MIPIEEVKNLKQPRMNYSFGGDPVEMEVYNSAMKKFNAAVDALVARYEQTDTSKQ